MLDPLSQLALLVTGQTSTARITEEQWADMNALAIQHGLAPMLLWQLRRERRFSAGDPRWAPLVEAARASALHYALLDKTRRAVTAALAGSNIPAVWLKGIALAHTVYPEPRLRPMQDLDVLVPLEQRRAARGIALGLGFKEPEGDYLVLIRAPEAVQHHDVLVGGPAGKVLLENHFRLLGLDGEHLLPHDKLAWFWEQTWAPDGLDFAVLKPEAHLLYLCAHAFLQHGEAYLDLLHLLDLHLLVTHYDLDWRLLVEQATVLGWSAALGRGVSLSASYFNTPLPPEVLRVLGDHKSGEVERQATQPRQQRVARWEEWQLLFGKMSLLQRLRLIWTTLFPPPSFLRDLYHLTPRQFALPYYFYHWWDAGREIARALTARWSGQPPKTSH
jgi:hypothetical protein